VDSGNSRFVGYAWFQKPGISEALCVTQAPAVSHGAKEWPNEKNGDRQMITAFRVRLANVLVSDFWDNEL